MKLSKKRMGSLFLAVLFLVFNVLFLAIPPPIARADEGIDRLCIPPLSGGKPSDWVSFEFVNRVTIKVTFSPGSKKCVSPSGLDLKLIHASGVEFGPLISGLYVDGNVSGNDDQWKYENQVGDKGGDDSRIDEFDNQSFTDPFGGHDKQVNADTIRKFIAPSEFSIGIEEDKVAAVTCDGTNSNFVFTKHGGDYSWKCEGSDIGNNTGMYIGGRYVGSLENFNITYNYFGDANSGKLVHVDKSQQNTRTFQWCTNEFRTENCNGDLYITGTNPEKLAAIGASTGDITIRKDGKSDTFQARVAGATNPSAAASQSTGAGTSGSEQSCEKGGGELSWILCPTLRLLSNFLGAVDEKLNQLLSLPSDYYDNPSLENSWARIRNLAYIILVPVMLIMIISTALGFEFVSAYTFKKALPRLLIAVLFISLSFEITKFLVVLTNNVGQGILGLITSAFAGQEEITIASLFDPDVVTGGLFSVGLLAGGVLALGVIPILISYAFVAAIVIFVAFLALALRQMLLITFMVMGPLAILAWIFPGNDKLWKLWWGGFSKLLLLFPLIMALIGGGRMFAALVQDAGGNDFLATILKLTAYIGPYFFIPAMFKFAGGIFATLTGMANDRERGFFDRQKKFRQKQAGNALHRGQAGNYFRGGTEKNLRGRLNRGLEGASLLPKAGLRPNQWRDKMQVAMGANAFDHASELMEKNEMARALLLDDDKAHAVLRGGNDAEQIKKILTKRAYQRFGGDKNRAVLNQAVAEIQTLNREAGTETMQVAALRSIGRSSTGWNNEVLRDNEGEPILDANGEPQIIAYDAAGKMLSDINLVAGSNRGMSNRLLAELRESQTRAGRNDTGGAGFSDTSLEMDKLYRGEKDGSYDTVKATEKVTEALIKGKSALGALGEKSHNGNAIAPVMRRMTEKAVYTGTEEEAIRALAQEGTVLDSLGSTSRDNAKIMGDKVFNQNIDLTKLAPGLREKLTRQVELRNPADPKSERVITHSTETEMTHAQVIEKLRDDPAFRAYRREYGQAYAAEAGRPGSIPSPGETGAGGAPGAPFG